MCISNLKYISNDEKYVLWCASASTCLMVSNISKSMIPIVADFTNVT